MTRIILIRHGDTIYNKETVFRGTLDVPLNEVGKEQARLTGLEISDTKISYLASSPLSRALDTASAVAEHQDVEPVIDESFMDLNFGSWQGRSKDEVQEAEPELFEQWMRDPASVRFPGGETLKDVSARASKAVENMRNDFEGETIAVATHRVVVKLLVLQMLGLPESEFWRIMVDTCSVTTFDHHKDLGYILKRHNHTAHLAPLKKRMTSKDF